MSKDFSIQYQEYTDRAVELSTLPPVLYIETVRGCPYTCAMCHIRQTKPKRIDQELLKKIEPAFPGLEIMAIHGLGEPLLADLDYFVDKAVENDTVLHMNTTGFFMDKKKCDLLAKARLSIRFSIHSGTPKSYKNIMGQDFNKVRDNIAYLMEQVAPERDKHYFCFSFIVIKENVDEIEDFLRLAHELDIRDVRFQRLNSNFNSMRGYKLPDRDFTFNYFKQFNQGVVNTFQERLPRYKQLSEELGINIGWGTMPTRMGQGYNPLQTMNTVAREVFKTNIFPLSRPAGRCLAPWFGQPIVRQNGNVTMCCAAPFYVIGNLYESTLAEIWNSDKIQRIRESFKKGRIPRECGYCQGFSFDQYPLNSFPEYQK